jgi:hypothetical protein
MVSAISAQGNHPYTPLSRQTVCIVVTPSPEKGIFCSLCFQSLTHSFAGVFSTTPLQSYSSALFAKNTGGGYTLTNSPHVFKGLRTLQVLICEDLPLMQFFPAGRLGTAQVKTLVEEVYSLALRLFVGLFLADQDFDLPRKQSADGGASAGGKDPCFAYRLALETDGDVLFHGDRPKFALKIPLEHSIDQYRGDVGVSQSRPGQDGRRGPLQQTALLRTLYRSAVGAPLFSHGNLVLSLFSSYRYQALPVTTRGGTPLPLSGTRDSTGPRAFFSLYPPRVSSRDTGSSRRRVLLRTLCRSAADVLRFACAIARPSAMHVPTQRKFLPLFPHEGLPMREFLCGEVRPGRRAALRWRKRI